MPLFETLLAGYDPEKYVRDVRTDEEHSRRVQENGASTRGRWWRRESRRSAEESVELSRSKIDKYTDTVQHDASATTSSPIERET